MDYAFCQALAQNTITPKSLLIYDIMCSWSKHFLQRVSQSNTLSLREDLQLLYGIGNFHLGAHIQECFPQFSLNFIQGAGQMDGEILETLWSHLNKVAGSTSAMSQGQRQEILDNFMNDSNWKKLIKSGIIYIFICMNVSDAFAVQSIIQRWKKAVIQREEMRSALDELTDRISEEWIEEWKELEERAMQERGDALKIYDIAETQGMLFILL